MICDMVTPEHFDERNLTFEVLSSRKVDRTLTGRI